MSTEMETKQPEQQQQLNNPTEYDVKKALSNRWLESYRTEGPDAVRERLKSSWDSIAIICALISGFSYAAFFAGVSPTNYSEESGNWELREAVYLWSQAITFIISTASVLLTVVLTQQIVHVINDDHLAWFLYNHPNTIRFPVMAVCASIGGLFVTFCCGVFLFMNNIAAIIIVVLIGFTTCLPFRTAFMFERGNDKYMVFQNQDKGFTEDDINLQSCGGFGKKLNDCAACCCCIPTPNVYKLPIKPKHPTKTI